MKALYILDKLEFKEEENRETVTKMLYDLIETDIFINEDTPEKKEEEIYNFLKNKGEYKALELLKQCMS